MTSKPPGQRHLDKLLPVDRVAPEGSLPMWVIYRHPKDAPDECVLRCQWVTKDGGVTLDKMGWYGPTVDDLREIVPPGLTRVPRFRNDDPAIVEVWL